MLLQVLELVEVCFNDRDKQIPFSSEDMKCLAAFSLRETLMVLPRLTALNFSNVDLTKWDCTYSVLPDSYAGSLKNLRQAAHPFTLQKLKLSTLRAWPTKSV